MSKANEINFKFDYSSLPTFLKGKVTMLKDKTIVIQTVNGLDNDEESLQYLKNFSKVHISTSTNSLNKLPDNIKYLSLIYNDDTYDNLPKKLQYLIIQGDKESINIDNLPQSLKFLDIDIEGTCNTDNLPSNLKILKISYSHFSQITIDNIPDSIEYLIISFFENMNIRINKLPKSLKQIDIPMRSALIDYKAVEKFLSCFSTDIKLEDIYFNYITNNIEDFDYIMYYPFHYYQSL